MLGKLAPLSSMAVSITSRRGGREGAKRSVGSRSELQQEREAEARVCEDGARFKRRRPSEFSRKLVRLGNLAIPLYIFCDSTLHLILPGGVAPGPIRFQDPPQVG